MVSELEKKKLSVSLNSEGALVIKGRSIEVGNNDAFDVLIRRCQLLNIPQLCGTVNLDYVNCASYRKLFELFQTIDENDKIEHAQIVFFVDKDDEDMIENWGFISDSSHKVQYTTYLNR